MRTAGFGSAGRRRIRDRRLVRPNEHRMEGPFGDHTGFYTPQDLFPVMHVTAITHRKDAIYPTTIVGKPPMEDYWMGKATERLFLPLMKLFMGEIVDVNMPAEGVFHNLVIVSIKKRFPGHAQKVMYGLWGLGLMMLAKAILVVDAEVDVQDIEAVAEEVLNNVDWRRDVTVVDGAVDQLDHSAIQDSVWRQNRGRCHAQTGTRPAARICRDPRPRTIDGLVGRAYWLRPRRGLLIGRGQNAAPRERAIRALWTICPGSQPRHARSRCGCPQPIRMWHGGRWVMSIGGATAHQQRPG